MQPYPYSISAPAGNVSAQSEDFDKVDCINTMPWIVFVRIILIKAVESVMTFAGIVASATVARYLVMSSDLPGKLKEPWLYSNIPLLAWIPQA